MALNQGEPAAALLTEFFREMRVPALGSMVQRLVDVVGSPRAVSWVLRLIETATPYLGPAADDGAAKDPTTGLDAMRRQATTAALAMLLSDKDAFTADELLSQACRPMVHPDVRRIVRAHALRELYGAGDPNDLRNLLADPYADRRAREVAAWSLALLGGEQQPDVTSALFGVAGDRSAPGSVRMTALESLVALHRDHDAVSILVMEAGSSGTDAGLKTAKPHGPSRPLYDAVLSRSFELLAKGAWDSAVRASFRFWRT